ncbi:MAG TPA: chemotaxis protein CheW [Blastocatellia bacterium]|jgi:chemotaxis signal transduction protein|nr:chemotaxis protein CheW [Blastocatellia bacterium]
MAKEKKAAKNKPVLEVGPIPFALFEAEPVEAKSDVVSVLMFEVGRKPFAIAVEHTEGVVDCPRISPLPSPPDGLVGVASVRGRMTLVMDLSLMANPNEGKWRLILVRGDAQAGLLAERVEGVIALEPKNLHGIETSGEAGGSQRVEEGLWPVRAYFESEGQPIPVIDVERLAEI